MEEVEAWLHSPEVRAHLAEDLRVWSGILSPETLATNLVVGLTASWQQRCSSGSRPRLSGGPSAPSGGSAGVSRAAP